jgi:DNA-binding transcriptional MerR regulator
VRYYEELGLTEAGHREPNGYRTYTEQHLYGLRLVRRAKLLGLSLAEIKELAEVFPEHGPETSLIQRSIEVLTSHLDKVGEKQRELEAYHTMLAKEVTRLKGLLQGRIARA